MYRYIEVLVNKFKKPITATSANLAGRSPHYSIKTLFNELAEKQKQLIDLVIDAFNRLNLPLKVAGDGAEIEKLRGASGPNVEFLGRVSDEELRNLYSGAKAFIFPALEDAGIMPLEALACGTPVIGLNKGGVAEFIKDGEHGVLFADQTIDGIFSAEKKLAMTNFDPEKLRARALEFDKEIFKEKIRAFINIRIPQR